MNTQEMMKTALKLAGIDKVPADSVIQVEGEDIQKVLAGIDMGTAEVAVAHSLGYDCVARHHPQDLVMANVGQMEYDVHFERMVAFGVPPTVAQKLLDGKTTKTFKATHSINYAATGQMAKLLNIASLSIHTPADLIVQRDVQKQLDALSEKNPGATLKDVVDSLMEIREYNSTPQHPYIAVGNDDGFAGKIMVDMAGGSAASLEEYKAYLDAGVNTFVVMHMKPEVVDELAKDSRCNAVIAGHYASDSYGFNRILDAWEQAGLEITRIGGIV